jgi:hypothetical protein
MHVDMEIPTGILMRTSSVWCCNIKVMKKHYFRKFNLQINGFLYNLSDDIFSIL